MNEALVVVLALLWAVALLPGAVRSRRVNTHATVGGFERAMDVLRRQPDGRYMMVPHDAGRIVGDDGDRPSSGERAAPATSRRHREDPRVARRRAAFLRALAATSVLFVVAVVVGGFAWTLFTLALVATVGYAALLRHLKLQRDQARAKVRHLRAEVGDVRVVPEERIPVAVGSSPMFADRVPVASGPDEPWEPQTAVRIRRWDD